jgi:hypothetical protein
MKYGIYDTQSESWVKRGLVTTLKEGLYMTIDKSEALGSESKEFVEDVFTQLGTHFKDRPLVLQGLEVREL